jgi:hypothetical protein
VGLTLAAALAAALGAAAPAHAQQEPELGISFGIGGGASVPLRNAKERFTTGFNGHGLVQYDFSHAPLALRGEFSYQSFDLRGPALKSAGATSGTGTLLAGIGAAKLYVARGHVRPYVLAGAGVYTVKIEPDGIGMTRSDARLGVIGGGGFMFTFGSLVLYAESRLDHLFVDRAADPTGSLDIVPVTIGVLF